MDQQVWNPIFSPSGTTPGKSPSYYNELDQHQQQPHSQQHTPHHQQQPPPLVSHDSQQHIHQQHQQLHGHSNHSTPAGNAIQLNVSTSQQPTPTQMSGNTPGTFSETDQMFLQQMDYYEQQQLSHHASAGNTPGPNTGSMAFNNPPPPPPPHLLPLQQQQQQQQQQHTPHNHHQQQHHHSHSHSHSQDMHQHMHLESNGPSNHNTPGSTTGPPPLPSQSYDLGLENMNFIIPEVLNFDTDPNHVSSAFPPELPSHQTPSLLAVNKLKQEEQLKMRQQQESSASPILRGQNDKSYNPQHYYHRQSSSGKIFTTSSQSSTNNSNNSSGNNNSNNNNAASTTVRPDAVFTPLVSPAVTPLDRGNAANSFSPQPPLQIAFEPLTSPVLKTEPLTVASSNASTSGASTATDDRRRSSSSVYAPSKDENKQYKRRTPHGTPVLQGSKSSYISPSLKGKSGGSSGSTPQQFTFEKLPESKVKTESSRDQDMLPPSGKPVEINGTPLMGFTMGKLAEGNELRQTSPTMSISSSSKKSSAKSSRKSSISKHQQPKSTSSSESSSPKLNTSGGKKSNEKPATKKASHKLAEQGRRNRMNMAVQELGRLIPQSYHDEVSIPSKATTVELASKYINTLLKEIDELKSAEKGSTNSNDENNGKYESDD
ncbi:hypothetical protein Cantr_05918 [Candida viswanathii]|uniref:BHLH domain-containing protein n=1 Tax=Candida viswanathii TaxID=5486 RepID=A0A367XPS2_9ASCO|nr:hypothetical protein Cantr_05918 [Candida viswanathii]